MCKAGPVQPDQKEEKRKKFFISGNSTSLLQEKREERRVVLADIRERNKKGYYPVRILQENYSLFYDNDHAHAENPVFTLLLPIE